MKSEGLPNFILSEAKASGFHETAFEYYLTHETLVDRIFLDRQRLAEHKTIQAGWLFILSNLRNTECKKLGFESKEDTYRAGIGAMNEQAVLQGWHSWKCNSVDELRKRLKPFKGLIVSRESIASALETLISKKIGNANATILGVEQQGLAVAIYADGTEKTLRQAFTKYTDRAHMMIELGLWNESDSLVSESAFIQFLNKPAVKAIWWEARKHKRALKKLFN